MSEHQQFRKRVYERYRTASLSPGNQRTHSLVHEIAQYHARWHRILSSSEHNSAIDLGCGGGEFLCFLREDGFSDLHGIDISPQQVALARQRGLQGVIESDVLTALQSDTRRYDVIAALNLLEHLTRNELLMVLDAVCQRLTPTGLLLAVVPNARGVFGAKVRWADITHELSFTPESVRQVFNLTGLELVAIREHGPIVHGPISLVRWCMWQVVRAAALIAIIAETGNYKDRCLTQDMIVIGRRAQRKSEGNAR